MLKKVSDKIALSIGTQLQVDDDQVEIYSYGLQVFIGATLKLLVILSLSLILGIFKEVAVYLTFFILLRKCGGGVHLSTYAKCLSIGTVMILGFAKLATLNISTDLLIVLITIVFLGGCFCTVKWVPAGTEKKTVTDVISRKKQKAQVFILLIVWLICVVFLNSNQQIQYALAATLGVACSFFFISPLGYRIIKLLDKTLTIRKEV
ncbi:accessory gene regulator B family protein [Peptococcaceae bacterium 1198_IL3148]